jgi:hypothetical protein
VHTFYFWLKKASAHVSRFASFTPTPPHLEQPDFLLEFASSLIVCGLGGRKLLPPITKPKGQLHLPMSPGYPQGAGVCADLSFGVGVCRDPHRMSARLLGS